MAGGQTEESLAFYEFLVCSIFIFVVSLGCFYCCCVCIFRSVL